MNFLELCQSLRAEAGLSGTGPAAVTGQSGMNARLVDWIGQAYSEILKMEAWSFLWARVSSFTLTSGVDLYATTALGVSDLGRMYRTKMFDITTPTIPVRLTYVNWTTIDEAVAKSGAPRMWSRRPDKQIVFYPTPDTSYPIKYDYAMDGHVLAANTDTPIIPDTSLHKIIVMKALTYYGMYDENTSAVQDGDRQFNLLLGQMADRYLPASIAAPYTLDSEVNETVQELV